MGARPRVPEYLPQHQGEEAAALFLGTVEAYLHSSRWRRRQGRSGEPAVGARRWESREGRYPEWAGSTDGIYLRVLMRTRRI